MLDNINDFVNKYIKTQASNNWNIPLDSTISARTGPLAKLQDLVYSSDAGRKAMGAIDTFNKFTGGPDLGNVTPGASHAITPALESLSSEGLIKKAMDLFGKDRGYFMDKSADIYDLGHMYAPGNLTHPEVLDKIGQLPYEYHAGQPVGYDLPAGLDQTNLMRVRRGGGVTGIETTQKPSNAMMEQLIGLFEKEPTTGASLELHDLPNQRKLDQFFPNPQHAIDAIYNFFK